MDDTTAVVLGGSGLAGIGWMIGVLAALDDAGALDLATVDQVVGTSAGASVGAMVLGTASAPAIFDDMVRATRRTAELAPAASLGAILPEVLAVHGGDGSRADKTARFVALSDRWAGVDPALRRDAIARRLGTDRWPAGRLEVTAVRADGRTVVFDRSGDVGLVDAVTASCAVPGLWPAVELADGPFVDGGTFSSTNAEIAARAGRVVVLQPQPELEQYATPDRTTVLSRATVITPSPRARSGFGDDPFDPDVRGVAAVLGYDDGVRAAPLVARGVAHVSRP